MDSEIGGDVLSLARDIVSLLHARELEKAAERLSAARREVASRSFEVRSDVIRRINGDLVCLRQARTDVRAAVDELPQEERIFAQVQIDPLLEAVFSVRIAELKALKRRHAKPRGGAA